MPKIREVQQRSNRTTTLTDHFYRQKRLKWHFALGDSYKDRTFRSILYWNRSLSEKYGGSSLWSNFLIDSIGKRDLNHFAHPLVTRRFTRPMASIRFDRSERTPQREKAFYANGKFNFDRAERKSSRESIEIKFVIPLRSNWSVAIVVLWSYSRQ